MPKIRENRKCAYCDSPAKQQFHQGRFKGYLRTCGSIECRKQFNNNSSIRLARARLKLAKEYTCELCGVNWVSNSRSGRFCANCTPEKTWKHRAERYGIGKPQWESMLALQNGKCALCECVPEAVDHDHSTGKVRGLLCYKCNFIVGVIEAADPLIDSIRVYLEKHNVEIDSAS